MKQARAALLLGLVCFSMACSPSGVKKNYLVAEKLWTDGKYAAAVTEFQKIYAKDPSGALGLQALHRAGTTQAYFLSQYGEAVKTLRLFVERTQDANVAWEAQKEIGELLFTKTEQYDQALQHYLALVKQRPDAKETPEFLFRIAKSHFYLWQFNEAAQAYQDLMKRFPQTAWAEQAMYQLGMTYLTRGGHQGSRGDVPAVTYYQEAIRAFEAFAAKHPASPLAPEAKFGIASCLEEMDQLDAAYRAYENLKDSYPSPKVIQIKLYRIKERKAQRSH